MTQNTHQHTPTTQPPAGRRIRDEVENKFERAYYLKTLSWGALTRRWPAGYSVWLEDERVEEGYRLLRVGFGFSFDGFFVCMERDGRTLGGSVSPGLPVLTPQFHPRSLTHTHSH